MSKEEPSFALYAELGEKDEDIGRLPPRMSENAMKSALQNRAWKSYIIRDKQSQKLPSGRNYFRKYRQT